MVTENLVSNVFKRQVPIFKIHFSLIFVESNQLTLVRPSILTGLKPQLQNILCLFVGNLGTIFVLTISQTTINRTIHYFLKKNVGRGKPVDIIFWHSEPAPFPYPYKWHQYRLYNRGHFLEAAFVQSTRMQRLLKTI